MKRLIDWLRGSNHTLELPEPFDVDLEDAYLDGPSALAAEKPIKYDPKNWKANYEKWKKRQNPELHPPKRPTPPPFDEDPAQAQYYEPPAAKRGKPFAEWKEGEDHRLTDFYAAVGQDWVNAPPLAEHYNPALSKSRKARSEEWRSTKNKGNYQPTDQPLGGNIQVVVDMSTKITFAYCQKGHVHAYHNGNLQAHTRMVGKSRHFPDGITREPYVPTYNNMVGLTDKKIVESPDCD